MYINFSMKLLSMQSQHSDDFISWMNELTERSRTILFLCDNFRYLKLSNEERLIRDQENAHNLLEELSLQKDSMSELQISDKSTWYVYSDIKLLENAIKNCFNKDFASQLPKNIYDLIDQNNQDFECFVEVLIIVNCLHICLNDLIIKKENKENLPKYKNLYLSIFDLENLQFILTSIHKKDITSLLDEQEKLMDKYQIIKSKNYVIISAKNYAEEMAEIQTKLTEFEKKLQEDLFQLQNKK